MTQSSVRKTKRLLLLGIYSIFWFFCLSCSSSSKENSREVLGQAQGQHISQAELQQDIQRFASSFWDRTSQAMEPLLASSGRVRQTALRQLLRYQASVLEIATGPTPEANLLDMIVFIRLTTEVAENHWAPKVYGPKGQALVDALKSAQKDLWAVADKVMNQQQKQRVLQLVRDWQNKNPEQRLVEAVRLTDFSSLTGQDAERQAKQAQGLLAGIKSATMTADEALLIAERSLYLAQRFPFLLRLHTRLATGETLSELDAALSNVDITLQNTAHLRPLVRDLTTLTDHLTVLIRESQSLIKLFQNKDSIAKRAPASSPQGDDGPEEVQGPPASDQNLNSTLEAIERITSNINLLLQELKDGGSGGQQGALSLIIARTDQLARRITAYTLLIAAGIAFFGWGGYYVIRKSNTK